MEPKVGCRVRPDYGEEGRGRIGGPRPPSPTLRLPIQSRGYPYSLWCFLRLAENPDADRPPGRTTRPWLRRTIK